MQVSCVGRPDYRISLKAWFGTVTNQCYRGEGASDYNGGMVSVVHSVAAQRGLEESLQTLCEGLLPEEPLAMAGLWESWRDPDGVVVRTFCVITTEANALMAQIHERMPVLLRPGDFGQWLDPGIPGEELRELLGPYPVDPMEAWPVSKAVSRARNEGAELIKRVP